MSQAKVDKYKQEKYNRKKNNKKSNFKKIAAYVVCAIIAAAFVVYIGYSIGVTTGLIEKPTETTTVTRTKEEKESIRDYLIQQGDPNVKTDETTAALEDATEAETTVASEDATEAETTAAE